MMTYNCCILAIMKDEDHIYHDWIRHHINMGFDHIYLFDDCSVNVPITDQPSKVTIFSIDQEFYDKEKFQKSNYFHSKIYSLFSKNKALYFYNFFLFHHRYRSKWILLIDVDEFLYLDPMISLHDFLIQNENYDRIFCSWLMHGSSFLVEKKSWTNVQDSFPYHESHYDCNGKSFFKPQRFEWITNGHTIHENTENIKSYDHSVPLFTLEIYINHYIVLDIMTYYNRKRRFNIGQTNGMHRNIYYYIKTMHLYNTFHSLTQTINDILFTYKNSKKESLLNILGKAQEDVDSYYHSFFQEKKGWTCVPICEKDIIFLPKDFCVESYKRYNPDLHQMSKMELIFHWFEAGKKENRIYRIFLPCDFDPEKYKFHNPDLRPLSDDEASKHYYLHGNSENRQYK